MRITLLAAFSAALVATLAFAGSGTASSPALRVKAAPLTVVGSGFSDGARVHVVFTAGRSWSRDVIASAGGAFQARFTIRLGRCTRYAVTAWDANGMRATLRSRQTDCSPQ